MNSYQGDTPKNDNLKQETYNTPYSQDNSSNPKSESIKNNFNPNNFNPNNSPFQNCNNFPFRNYNNIDPRFNCYPNEYYSDDMYRIKSRKQKKGRRRKKKIIESESSSSDDSEKSNDYIFVIQITKITTQHLTNNVEIATMVYENKKEAEDIVKTLRNDEKYRFMYINLKKLFLNTPESSFVNILKNTH